MSRRLSGKVLLIGWDSADWQIINPLLELGLMPTLASFIDQGVIGNLSTVRPILSPILWNSIATGKRADKHGILGFIEPRSDGNGIQAVSSTSRRTKAIWNILSQNNLKSNVVSWFASHPAEPINGVCVSQYYANVESMRGRASPPPPQSIHPARLFDRLAELRVPVDGITAQHIFPFVPSIGDISPAETPPISGIQKMLARCATVHNAATELIEHEPWDFMAVYYETLDHFCHGFMQYHPPKMPNVSQELFERYKDVVTSIYRYHDMMLDRLLQLASDDTTVILCSDHGFLNDHLRPIQSERNRQGPEAWHRFHGIFAMKGPGVLRDERIYGANILDIVPTILTLFGLPVGTDMDGKALVQCFERPPKIQRVESWDTIEGDAGLHPPDLRVDPYDQQAAVQQLVELGYIAAPQENQQRAMSLARSESHFNLAMAQLDAGRIDKSVRILETLHDDTPGEARYAAALAQAYFARGRLRDCRNLIESTCRPDERTPQHDMMLGEVEFAEGNVEQAMAHLERAETANPRLPALHCQIGTIYLKQRRWRDAERAFRKAIEIDADSAIAHYGLGQSLLRNNRIEEAIESTLRSVGLMHYFPRAHFQLGQALVKMGWHERAIKAFETALSLRPAMPAAHRYLSALYRELGDVLRSKAHADAARRILLHGKP